MEEIKRFGSVSSWEEKACGRRDRRGESSSSLEEGIASPQDGEYVALRRLLHATACLCARGRHRWLMSVPLFVSSLDVPSGPSGTEGLYSGGWAGV